ncbi:MAG: hypothetical protein U1E78_02425 [Gammaproteobacteria bacterium]
MFKKCIDLKQAKRNGRTRAYTRKSCPTYQELTNRSRNCLYYSSEAASAYIKAYLDYQSKMRGSMSKEVYSKIKKFNELLDRSYQFQQKLLVEEGGAYCSSQNTLLFSRIESIGLSEEAQETNNKSDNFDSIPSNRETIDAWINTLFI